VELDVASRRDTPIVSLGRLFKCSGRPSTT